MIDMTTRTSAATDKERARAIYSKAKSLCPDADIVEEGRLLCLFEGPDSMEAHFRDNVAGWDNGAIPGQKHTEDV